jgi:hypothetical protein
MSPAALPACLLLAAGLTGAARGAEWRRTTLEPVPGAVRLAATTNGQTVFCLDGPRRALVAIDPFAPGRVRDVVAPPGPAAPQPVAIAMIDSGVIAAVCRAGDIWDLRTWRLRPDGTVAADAPLQVVPLGTAAGGVDQEVDLAVGGGRRWIAVSGLPSPLPPVLRAALARVQVGPLTSRSCPPAEAGVRPVAVTAGPQDELVLFERGADGDIVVSYHDSDGRRVLRLETGLVLLRDAAFAPGGGTLWVVAADATGASGLWRLEATLRAGRQAIRAALVTPLEDPLAVTAPTDRAVVVCRAAGPGTAERPLELLDLPAHQAVPPEDPQRTPEQSPDRGGGR